MGDLPTSAEILVDQLRAAALTNKDQRECQACVALKAMPEEAREATRIALLPSGHGSIGGTRLAKILTANGYPTGVRAISRHRREDHTP